MHVRLGAPVLGKDIVQVGKVDRIVIDRKSLQIIQLMVKQGHILTKDRIINRDAVNHVDDEGRVYLNVTSREAEGLQEYFVTDYTPPGQHSEFSWTRAVGEPLGGPITTISDTSTRYANIADNVSVVEKGMDVNDRDGVKIGELEDLEFDENARVTGFTVSSGRRNRKEHRSFAVERVVGVGTNYVRLNITADEVRAMAPSMTG